MKYGDWSAANRSGNLLDRSLRFEQLHDLCILLRREFLRMRDGWPDSSFGDLVVPVRRAEVRPPDFFGNFLEAPDFSVSIAIAFTRRPRKLTCALSASCAGASCHLHDSNAVDIDFYRPSHCHDDQA